MSDFRMRIIEENQQLKHKIAALANFILSPEFTAVSEKQQGLLKLQHNYMTAYQSCLAERLHDIDGKTAKGDGIEVIELEPEPTVSLWQRINKDWFGGKF